MLEYNSNDITNCGRGVFPFMENLIKKLLNNYYFCIFYIITSLIVVTCFQFIPFIGILTKVAIAWGLLISLSNLYKMIKHKPNIIEILLYVFLFYTLIVNLVFYNNSSNLIVWLVTFIILSSFLCINKEKSKEELTEELLSISKVYVIITAVLSLLSLLLYFTRITMMIGITTIGYKNGLYNNENALGIAAAICILLSLYLFLSTNNKVSKISYISICILQAIMMIISTSRSSALMLIAIILVFIFLKAKNNILRSVIILVPICATFVLSRLSEGTLVKLTSGRIELWKNASIVISKHFFFGVGNSNMISLVKAARDAVLPGINYGGLHNIYLQILAVNGIFALLIFLALIILSLYKIVTKIDSIDFKTGKNYYILLSLICGIFAINLFESNIVYILSFISIILWTYLGYTLSIIDKE